MGEASSDRRIFADFGDSLAVGSSIGWTDEKHMHYLSSLEESFVSQLYESEFNLNGLHHWSPRSRNHINSSRADDKKMESDLFKVLRRGCWRMLEFDRAKSTVSQIEHVKSSCCEDLQVRTAHCMDDDASTTNPIQEEAGLHARESCTARSPARCFRKHQHCISRSTEASGQNFIDEEAEGTGDSRRRCKKMRFRSPGDNMLNDQVVPFEGLLVKEYRKEKDGYSYDNSSEVEVGLLNTQPAPASFKDREPKG